MSSEPQTNLDLNGFENSFENVMLENQPITCVRFTFASHDVDTLLSVLRD
jgi:hypothetical protein